MFSADFQSQKKIKDSPTLYDTVLLIYLQRVSSAHVMTAAQIKSRTKQDPCNLKVENW